MKKSIGMLFIIAFTLIGLFLVSYPYVSFWLSQRNQSYAVQWYGEAQAKMSEKEREAAFAQAQAYNESLLSASFSDPFASGQAPVPVEYLSVLNITSDGMMGYIKIPKIRVEQPFFHGVSEKVLKKGVGHLPQSSVPVGGAGTHSVLTAHSGLNHSKMFTDLERLEIGDEFYIYVLNQVLAYRIDQILVVEPDDTEALGRVVGKEYATLITCTPYSVNSHRLLVRGQRVPYSEEQLDAQMKTAKTALGFEEILLIAGVATLGVLSAMLLVSKRIKRRKQSRHKNAENP